MQLPVTSRVLEASGRRGLTLVLTLVAGLLALPTRAALIQSTVHDDVMIGSHDDNQTNATVQSEGAVSQSLQGVRQASVKRCGPDAVVAGTMCLDKYEASVWRVPNPSTTNALLVRKIRLGRATQADLSAGGATQLGTVRDDYAPCTNNGQNCVDDIYAVSLPSVIPSAHITWFQAQEACANAAKRLPTSSEWQVGANGTPDPGPDNGTTDCNSQTGSASPTGARSSCVSARGAFDMVGNLYEWVADWVPLTTTCSSWGSFSNDDMCLTGPFETTSGPGALLRGGNFNSGAFAGPLSVAGDGKPSFSSPSFGLRCAR